MLYHACQRVGMPQEPIGAADLSHFHQPPDVGRADGHPSDFHLGDNIAAHAQFRAFPLQKLRRTLILMPEMMVVACHQMHGVPAAHQKLRHEVLPAGGHHLVVKGGHNHIFDAIKPPDKLLSVLRGVDQRAGDSGDHLFRRPVEGKDRRHAAPLLCRFHGSFQQRGVAQVYPVKKAQGYDAFRGIGFAHGAKSLHFPSFKIS